MPRTEGGENAQETIEGDKVSFLLRDKREGSGLTTLTSKTGVPATCPQDKRLSPSTRRKRKRKKKCIGALKEGDHGSDVQCPRRKKVRHSSVTRRKDGETLCCAKAAKNQ